MAIGFKIDFLWYQIGHGDFLHSFFSTICYHLENGKWGERYPYLMNKFYRHGLNWQDVKYAKKELKEVRKKLEEFPPTEVVWDIDNMSKQPPWGNNISAHITSMSNYFVTSDGRDLISVMLQAFDDAETEKTKIEIVSL